MHEQLRAPITSLIAGHSLSKDTVATCVGAIMDGECDAIDIAAFLTAMTCKGPDADEVVGAALAMRSRADAIPTLRAPLLDTCGTGGDRLHTFNISTATALVAAACGVNVAKHGNRSVSSSSGSADVLESLGVNIGLTATQAGACLDELGIAFCFAPMLHGAMKHAAPVRRHLGFPTIFNLLGPLTNPAQASCQLIGASSIARAELLATAICRLGIRSAIVVCGNNELDEVCLWGPTTAFVVSNQEIRRIEWTTADFGLPACRVEDIQVSSAAQSANVIRGVLQGQPGAATSMVIANAAAALLAAEAATNVAEAVQRVQTVLDQGKAMHVLEHLVRVTNKLATPA